MFIHKNISTLIHSHSFPVLHDVCTTSQKSSQTASINMTIILVIIPVTELESSKTPVVEQNTTFTVWVHLEIAIKSTWTRVTKVIPGHKELRLFWVTSINIIFLIQFLGMNIYWTVMQLSFSHLTAEQWIKSCLHRSRASVNVNIIPQNKTHSAMDIRRAGLSISYTADDSKGTDLDAHKKDSWTRIWMFL